MKDFKSSVKGVVKIYRLFRWRILISVLIGMVRIALSLGFVWICKLLIDVATGVSDKSLEGCIAIFIGIIITRILCNMGASYWENLTIVKAKNHLRYEVFAHTLRSSWHGKEEYHSADILNRIQEDVRVMVDLVCSRIPEVIITVVQLIAASVYLVKMAPKLLGLLLVLMFIAVLGSRMFYKIIRELSTLLRNLDSKCQQHIQENLQNRVLVLSLIGIERTLGKLSGVQQEIEKATIRQLNYNAIARGLMSIGFMAGYALAFLWGVYGIRDGSVTYGMMTAFLQLVGQVQRPIADISRHIPAFIQSLASEERLAGLMALKEDIPFNGKLLDEAPSIEFRNVNFAYPGQQSPTLCNFSHTFPAGSLTVITGPTGQGKSTLIRLAMGLLKPQSGTITPISIRNFMYVPQGNSLMSGTIRDNLLLANADATESDMRDALRTAVADFVFDLPDGLDTVCGESGAGLSEGQAQRIAIARSLLHTGTILVLDEATSALDNATEDEFLNRLAASCHGAKTIIFISHRTRVISYADEVLELS